MLLSFASCQDKTNGEDGTKEYKVRSQTVSTVHFNTYSSISTYKDDSDENIKSYVKIADELLGYYHKLFDIYYEYSGLNNLCTVNKNAGKSPVEVDDELIVFLEYCKELYTITNGKTNVMLGSVLKLWHDCREEANENFGFLPSTSHLPTQEDLTDAAAHTDINSLVIDKEAGTVYISDPKAAIDVGAIAKGYTVDILYERIKATGADSVALNIGGNIRTIGLKPNGDAWITGLTNPDKSSDDSLICRVEIGSTSMVTSGDYERFFYAGDKKYHHIIDPVTLVPAAYFSSVTIITENSGLADALSTALFCMTYEEGLELVSSIGGIEVIWIDLDYKMKTTDGVTVLPIK